MIHTRFLLTIISLSVLLLTACVNDDDDLEPAGQLVIEGWIEEGGYPQVYFSAARSPEEKNLGNINNYPIRWGKVTVSDGTETAVLTGVLTGNKYLPYRYVTYNIKGEAGKTYTLKAEYQGQTLTATTTIPPSVAIDSVKAIKTSNDSLYYIKVYFKDDPHKRNYYNIFCKRDGKDAAYLLSFMGVVSDETVKESVEVDAYRGTSIQTAMEEPQSTIYFTQGDQVHVKLAHMDHASYQFWNSYSNAKNLSSNMFFPFTGNIVSNVTGGKGYWCGYGISTRYVVIP